MKSNTTFSVSEVQSIYDKAYSRPGLMGTNLDEEYSQTTKAVLLEMCRVKDGGNLLDVGTGDGDLWTIVDTNLRAHAVDISLVGINRTMLRFPHVQGLVAIAEHLPYPTGYFQAVIAADTIEHVFNVEKALSEIKRVLKPGGRFALSVPTPNSLRKWAYNRFVGQRPSPLMFAQLIWTVLHRTLMFGHPTFQPIDRDLDIDQWLQFLKNAGFEVEQTISWPYPPLKPIVYLIDAYLPKK